MKTDLRINWLIAIFITGWVFYLLAPVLTPFVASALLAYVGDPLAVHHAVVDALQASGVRGHDEQADQRQL